MPRQSMLRPPVVLFIVLMLALLVLPLGAPFGAQEGVRAVVSNEFSNVRVAPALGAEVITTVQAGYVFERITARSSDSQWLQVDFGGSEAWVSIAPLTILSGDVAALPVRDPRSIPYGGFESPRSGFSTATSANQIRVTNNLRVRAGPSPAYPTLANMFAETVVPVFGRTPSGAWIQVNYEGTLGWVSTEFVQFLEVSLASLPIDGIVAESPPLSDATAINYIDTLKLMLARLDLAQPSLDNIRGKWTDAALNGRTTCRDYPARPSDINIAVPLLAANYGVLQPLQTDFNTAMFNVREAIDIFIDICNLPGTGNPVGQATVSGALNAVNLADQQFADLRARLLQLIPADREPGENECLFTYRQRSEILPVITTGQIVRVSFDPVNRSAGFCFDGVAGQDVSLQVLRISGNVVPLVALTPFDNPTNFTAIGTMSAGLNNFQLTPTLPLTARYLVLLNDVGDGAAPLEGELAVAIVNVPETGIVPTLSYDPLTDSVFLTTTPGVATPTPLPGSGANVPGAPGVSCPSTAFTCQQLFSCQEAYACLAAGSTFLDPDGDGVPCPNLCAPGG